MGILKIGCASGVLRRPSTPDWYLACNLSRAVGVNSFQKCPLFLYFHKPLQNHSFNNGRDRDRDRDRGCQEHIFVLSDESMFSCFVLLI